MSKGITAILHTEAKRSNGNEAGWYYCYKGKKLVCEGSSRLIHETIGIPVKNVSAYAISGSLYKEKWRIVR